MANNSYAVFSGGERVRTVHKLGNAVKDVEVRLVQRRKRAPGKLAAANNKRCQKKALDELDKLITTDAVRPNSDWCALCTESQTTH